MGPFLSAEQRASQDGGQQASWFAESGEALLVKVGVIDYLGEPGIQQFYDDLDTLSRKITAMGSGSATNEVLQAQDTVDVVFQEIMARCG